MLFVMLVITIAVFGLTNRNDLGSIVAAFRSSTLKEIDPQIVKNLKIQLYDDAVRNRPDDCARRLVFKGHHLAAPPNPLSINGFSGSEHFYIIAFKRRWVFGKCILIAPRRYVTPATQYDVVAQATGTRSHADAFYTLELCRPDGQPMAAAKLREVESSIKLFFTYLIRDYMYAPIHGHAARQAAQAAHGRATADIIRESLSTAGAPQAERVDETTGERSA